MYTSIFDSIRVRSEWFFNSNDIVLETMTSWDTFFIWTMESIFDQIQRILSWNLLLSEINFQDLVKLAYFPSMILKWLIEAKIEQQQQEGNISSFHREIHEVILETSQSCLEVFMMSEMAFQSIEESLYRIQNMRRGIPQMEVVWVLDKVSLLNYHPFLSQSSSTLVENIFSSNGGVFLSLWNGGLPVWMDVYLRSWIRDRVVYYPVRFSRYKSGDTVPQLNRVEEEFLETRSHRWIINIFDEDAGSWKTLSLAEDYIKKRIEKRKIYAFSNDGKYYSPAIISNSHLYSIEY